MSFRLIHANYDKKTRRAYVELRQDDADGDEMIVAPPSFLIGAQASSDTSRPQLNWSLTREQGPRLPKHQRHSLGRAFSPWYPKE